MSFKATRKETITKKREVIKSGKAWMRWLMIPVALLSVLDIIDKPYRWTGLILLVISVGLFYLLKRSRRLEHDEVNLYIIRDKKETIVPFTSIISIKRSGMKVNGSRPWKIRYEDHIRKKRKIWFFNDFFNKEFHNAVRIGNPKVVIWTHPHFAHAEDNKHNPDYND
tara:strand:- start:9006 stop:9506 length:501 start_codon:yes stop_codon:yes gene_type:complete